VVRGDAITATSDQD